MLSEPSAAPDSRLSAAAAITANGPRNSCDTTATKSRCCAKASLTESRDCRSFASSKRRLSSSALSKASLSASSAVLSRTLIVRSRSAAWATAITRSFSSLRRRSASCARWATEALSNRSEEHTSELQSLMRTSYAVFCLKKKKQINTIHKQYMVTILQKQTTTPQQFNKEIYHRMQTIANN